MISCASRVEEEIQGPLNLVGPDEPQRENHTRNSMQVTQFSRKGVRMAILIWRLVRAHTCSSGLSGDKSPALPDFTDKRHESFARSTHRPARRWYYAGMSSPQQRAPAQCCRQSVQRCRDNPCTQTKTAEVGAETAGAGHTSCLVGCLRPRSEKVLAAATRWSLRPDRNRPSNAASMVGAGTLSSAACCTVHLPARATTSLSILELMCLLNSSQGDLLGR
jgi:hypothetical protein